MKNLKKKTPERVQVCNLNPMFYVADHVFNYTWRCYPHKFVGSGYKPEPAGVFNKKSQGLSEM